MLNRLLWSAVESKPFSNFVTYLEQMDGPQANYLRILTYHRLESPQLFDAQMNYLAEHYEVVSMQDLVDAYQRGKRLPPRAVMVTFDDAYCDFAEEAWPILKRYHLPVTLFVPTAYPDHPERLFWWDRLYASVMKTARLDALDTEIGRLPLATAKERLQTYKRLRNYVKSLPHQTAMVWIDRICDTLGAPLNQNDILGWDALRQLAKEGVTMGVHTQTHPLMNRIAPDQMRSEAEGALHDLMREIGNILPVFAYPSGGFNATAIQVLEDLGFIAAFTTLRGINEVGKDHRLCLRRINVGQRTSLAVLRAQLLSWSVYLNRDAPIQSSKTF